jgi:DEAD/DEAH box helicase domain-containing protein
LSARGKALVLYPLKALLADQFVKWKRLADDFGLPDGTVAELHGQVLPDERLEAIRNARIIVATPDVLHAWFMRQVSAPAFKHFLCDLRYLVIDEAHSYESVFGSNVAYLLRRFLSARRSACRDRNAERPLQLIAATATIADPAGHMQLLTGCPFEAVEEKDDGSPSHGRVVLHIEAPDNGAASETAITDVLTRLLASSQQGSFIAFHDSRQGVERIAKSIDADDVLPYRSGFEADDRTRIEWALRRGELRGVISTSALELGIDVAHFTVGMTVGVPQSKKAFRQRLGRVGRVSKGAFAVLASRHAFTQFGSSFKQYYEGSVEPSHLYLGNRFIQFAQGKCLIDESEALGIEAREPPPGVSWPETFPSVFNLAKPGIRRPREFDFIAQLGANSAHFNYPLRQVGELNYKLMEGSREITDQIGDIALNQAIRETYPGALYLHLRRPMKVLEWRASSFDRSIRLQAARNSAFTKPILRKTVNIGLGPDEIVDSRIKSGPTGLLAEVYLHVNESVEGFRIGSNVFAYRDLRRQDPRMTRKQREFRTTGIVFKIEEPWFMGSGGPQQLAREAVADGLTQLILREKSISPNDVDGACTNIAFYENGAPRRATDTVVVYDSIYGGLRLTEPLFNELPEFLDRLEKAAELAGADAFVSNEIAEKLRAWYGSLREGTVSPERTLTPADGEYVIYTPGSEVAVLHQGVLVERRLLEPTLLPLGDMKMLMYQYDTGGRGNGFVPHDQIQPTGQDWSFSYWNPATGVVRPIQHDEGTF